MSKRGRWLVVVAAAALVVRCDCGSDDPDPRSGNRVSGSVYAGVGDICYGDSSGASSGGCGWGDESTTCAQGLLCCKNGDSSTRPWACVAAKRCGTSPPGSTCADDRDCQSAYTCVSHVCATSVGASCFTDQECITRHCINRRCGYEEPDLTIFDARPAVDLARDARRLRDLFRREARVRDQSPEAH